MDYARIRVGRTLRLKKERQAAYGMSESLVRVDRLVPRKGYKVGFVVRDIPGQASEFYRPYDFADEVGSALAGLLLCLLSAGVTVAVMVAWVLPALETLVTSLVPR